MRREDAVYAVVREVEAELEAESEAMSSPLTPGRKRRQKDRVRRKLDDRLYDEIARALREQRTADFCMLYRQYAETHPHVRDTYGQQYRNICGIFS